MRTLQNIKLLERIRLNPEVFIGQRNFDTLQSFMIPIESGTEIRYADEHIPTLESMPSIHEFVSEKLNIQIPSALRWTWAIGFNVEDQRELLESYFNWIFEYETQYPFLPENYQIIENKNRIQIAELLKHACRRPAMFGVFGLSGLRALIDGEFYLKAYFDSELTQNETKLLDFVNYWKAKTDKNLPFDTWDRPFGKERLGINPFTFPDGSNGGWGFERFIEIMENEVGLEFPASIIIT